MNNRIIEKLKKNGNILLTVLITALIIIVIFSADNLKSKTINEITVEISLPTIQCGMCESNISKALDKVKGVKSYSVDLDGKKVTVTYDDAVTSVSKIEKAISKAGYNANNTKADKKAYNKLHDCCKMPADR